MATATIYSTLEQTLTVSFHAALQTYNQLMVLRNQAIDMGTDMADDDFFAPLLDLHLSELYRLQTAVATERSRDVYRSEITASLTTTATAVTAPPPIPETRTMGDVQVLLSRKKFYEHIDSYIVRQRDLKGGPKVCGICMTSIEAGSTCHSPGCKHSFCAVCLYTWLTKHCTRPVCPACRFDTRLYKATRRPRPRKARNVSGARYTPANTGSN